MFKHLVECVLSAVCSLYPLGLDFGGGNSILEVLKQVSSKVEIVKYLAPLVGTNPFLILLTCAWLCLII